MTLPWLKDKEVGSASMPVESEDYDMLDAIAEDMISAMSRKDTQKLKAALAALCDHIKQEDIKQDAEMEKNDD